MRNLFFLSAASFTSIVALSAPLRLDKTFFKVRGGSSSLISMNSDPIPELKAPSAIYSGIAALGGIKATMSPLKILILGVLSGCHIGFGAFLSVAVGGACAGIAATNPGLKQIISGAFGLPFGLMMTVFGGGELFTGNTAILTTAVIEKKANLGDLIKSWVLSYTGNFIGSLLLAYLAFAGGTLGTGPASVAMAVAKTSLDFKTAFIRGILCNWLVCMAIYMSSGASSLASKMTAIFFPISAFIALGLEHSVANMFLIPLGIMRGADVSMSAFLLKNLLPVTLGNIVGGAVCVAMGYAASYGSLLQKENAPIASTASYGSPLREKGIPVTSAAIGTRGGMCTPNKIRTGSSYLPADTLERAAVGNMFEKVKIKKDPTEIWTDIHEWASAIREGKTNWEDISSDDLDIRVKYAGTLMASFIFSFSNQLY
jgi:formate/nitrite transporter